MKYVADFSDWQSGIDFSEISKHFDGVIVKITEGTAPQSCYQDFISQAINNNLPWGVYCYSHAVNEKQAVAEADKVIELLPGFPELGIWFDIEVPEVLNLSNKDITAVASAFICRCNEKGYSAGIYASLYTIYDKINTNSLASYVPYWVAAYSYSRNPLESSNLNVSGWQYRDDYPIGENYVDASEWYSMED